MAFIQSQFSNQLLRGLSAATFNQIAAQAEYQTLPKDFSFAGKGEVIKHGYFMESGIGSVVVSSPEDHRIEAGIFGREGFGPVSLALGVTTSNFDVFVQVPGDGHRIALPVLAELVAELPELNVAMQTYAHVLNLQTTYTALSNAVHQIDERLARWLLMCHDRSETDEIPLTHEFISLMLAVRRPSVTTALHVLEGNRFITSERGYITIRNREGLEHFAADAYGAPEAEYVRLFGPKRP